LLRYGEFFVVFKVAAVRHLPLLMRVFAHKNKGHLAVFITAKFVLN